MTVAGIVRGKRILVVHDIEAAQQCCRVLLEADQHTVALASNGLEALDLCRAGSFDLVIVDFEMSGRSGKEIAAQIKQLCPRLPILMLTCFENIFSSPDNPVDHILMEPFLAADLRGAVAKVLALQPSCT